MMVELPRLKMFIEIEMNSNTIILFLQIEMFCLQQPHTFQGCQNHRVLQTFKWSWWVENRGNIEAQIHSPFLAFSLHVNITDEQIYLYMNWSTDPTRFVKMKDLRFPKKMDTLICADYGGDSRLRSKVFSLVVGCFLKSSIFLIQKAAATKNGR